jgi:hypothetical protein
MEAYKDLVTELMTEGFVNDYEYHKECVDKLNDALLAAGSSFQYTYDEYCKDLMAKFILVVEEHFSSDEKAQVFFDNYPELVLNTYEQLKIQRLLIG